MAQHVRMGVNPETGQPAGFADDVLQRIHAQRAAAFGLEHVETRDLLMQLAQVAQFVAVHRVRAVLTALDPGDADHAGVQIDLAPAQADGFAGPQPVAGDQAHQHLVAERVAPALAGGRDQLVGLGGPQMAPRSDFRLLAR
jgi:hypothetical protein